MKKLGTILGIIAVVAVIGFRIYLRIKPRIAKDAFATAVLAINTTDFDYDLTDAVSADLKNLVTYENGKQVNKAPANYVEYIQKFKVPQIEEAITKVKGISYPDPAFKPIIDRSLDYLNATKKIYETDMVKLAEMKDKNATAEEIKKFQDEIKPKDNAILNQKTEALYEVAIKKKKKNEIEYSKGFGGRIMMKF